MINTTDCWKGFRYTDGNGGVPLVYRLQEMQCVWIAANAFMDETVNPLSEKQWRLVNTASHASK